MSTVIRPEISEKKKYHVPRHRYYELVHYCRQYEDWQRDYYAIDPFGSENGLQEKVKNGPADRTGDCAVKREELYEKMRLIKECSSLADPELANYIFMAVTRGYSYTYLQTCMNIPCCRDTYYNRYRRFFWYLSFARK